MSGPTERRPAGGGEKWKVNRAVRASTLPPPSRLIMMVLVDIADAGTAEVPPSRNPSTAQLARETGHSESTVKRHRAALQAAGWIVFTPPTLEQQRRHEPGTYKLRVPEGHQGPRVHHGPGSTVNPGGGSERTPVGGHAEPARGVTVNPLSSNDQNNDQKTTPRAIREAVDRVCQHLADRIEANGTPRPPIDGTWRSDAAALLFDDGHGEERAHKAIDFAHDDTFWRINITSPAKLRAKWHELRLSAERARQRAQAHDARTGAVQLPPRELPQTGPQRPAPADTVAAARARLSHNRTTFHAADTRHHRTDTKQEP